jgi:hypothetical protein
VLKKRVGLISAKCYESATQTPTAFLCVCVRGACVRVRVWCVCVCVCIVYVCIYIIYIIYIHIVCVCVCVCVWVCIMYVYTYTHTDIRPWMYKSATQTLHNFDAHSSIEEDARNRRVNRNRRDNRWPQDTARFAGGEVVEWVLGTMSRFSLRVAVIYMYIFKNIYAKPN